MLDGDKSGGGDETARKPGLDKFGVSRHTLGVSMSRDLLLSRLTGLLLTEVGAA